MNEMQFLTDIFHEFIEFEFNNKAAVSGYILKSRETSWSVFDLGGWIL